MQIGIHYTRGNQKVRVLAVDEENKIAYVDYLNGQKKWVNEKEYDTFSNDNIYEMTENVIKELPNEISDSIESIGVLNDEGNIENVKPIKKGKKKDDTANKK